MVTLFWVDVLVAQGLVVRPWMNDEGTYRAIGCRKAGHGTDSNLANE